MKRGLALCLVAVLALGLPACTSSRSDDRAELDPAHPNFVFVLTDDLSLNLVSHMPHVVAMQRDGTTMSNYFVVDSLCCPSRASIFTGQYPHDDGVFTNSGADGGYAAFQKNRDATKTFAAALQNHGYQTALMGKYLNGYKPKNHVPGGWSEWDVAGKGGYDELKYGMNVNGRTTSFGTSQADYLTDVLSSKAGDFVERATKPFLLEVATYAPHEPYTPAKKYAHVAATLSYPRTPAYGRTPRNAPRWLTGVHALNTKNDDVITQAYRKRVEADLSVDDLIAHLEQVLKRKGIARNTYLVFSSDNGYHMGEYSLLPGKQTAFDTDTHVPLVVVGPGVPTGRTVTQLASSIDLAPTFETLAGASVPGTVDGVSLDAQWHGATPASWQRGVLIEHHYAGAGPAQDPDSQNDAHADPPSYAALRTADASYVRYADGSEEYYDLTKDPYELDNLAGSGVPPALPRMLAALKNCHGSSACQQAAGA